MVLDIQMLEVLHHILILRMKIMVLIMYGKLLQKRGIIIFIIL